MLVLIKNQFYIFKIGDRVRIKDGGGSSNGNKGDIGIVENIEPDKENSQYSIICARIITSMYGYEIGKLSRRYAYRYELVPTKDDGWEL